MLADVVQEAFGYPLFYQLTETLNKRYWSVVFDQRVVRPIWLQYDDNKRLLPGLRMIPLGKAGGCEHCGVVFDVVPCKLQDRPGYPRHTRRRLRGRIAQEFVEFLQCEAVKGGKSRVGRAGGSSHWDQGTVPGYQESFSSEID